MVQDIIQYAKGIISKLNKGDDEIMNEIEMHISNLKVAMKDEPNDAFYETLLLCLEILESKLKGELK